jgi:RNA polymerase sigma-70 factor, ECF subfamily
LSAGRDELEQIRERLAVLRAQSGDRAAFGQLVTSYQERLMYYVHQLILDREASHDVLQEIWLDVFRKLGQLRVPEAFRVWLYRCAHHRAINHVRRRAAESQAREELAESLDGEQTWNELELLERAELVHVALARLSPAHREVMVLRFLEDMSLHEIAEVLSCNEGTAKSRLHYAKAALKRIIDQEQSHE